MPNPTLTVDGPPTFGFGSTGTTTELVDVVTDHFGDPAGPADPPADVAADTTPAGRDDTTGPDPADADADADAALLLELPADPADDAPPPRPDDEPESANATGTGNTAVPTAAANTPPANHKCNRANRRRCNSAAVKV